MLKRIMLLLTTFTIIFAFVTYQPKKVDAVAGVAAKVVAQQAIKAVTKTAVDSTVQRMLVKELLEEVTESYAKKQGYKLIESGGQKMYMKATYNETEKVLLKKQIDKVIDKEVYGNTPKFIQFLDWFVGVGAVIAVGQVLYATLTGEFQSYMSDIITEAMIDLGWLTPAHPSSDGTTPSNPVNYPSTGVPIYNSTSSTPPILDLSKTVIINESYQTTSNTTSRIYRMKLPSPVFQSGLVTYIESQPNTSNGMPNSFEYDRIATNNSTSSIASFSMGGSYPYNTLRIPNGGVYEFFVGGRITRKVTGWSSYSSSRQIDISSYLGIPDLNLGQYNRFIIQNQKYYPDKRVVVSRFIAQDTYLRQRPDIIVQLTEQANPSNTLINDYVDFYLTQRHNTAQFPTKIKLGLFTDIDVALDTGLLPTPVLDSADLKVPVVTNENRVPIPNVSILPGGYVYDPTEQVIKDPNGQVVTDPESLPLPTPDPVITETPDGEVVIDDTPTGVPVPPGGTSPPTNDGGTGDGMTTGDPTNIEWDKLKAIPNIFTKKFPFSLPWDAKRFIDSVLGDIPEAKDIVVNVEEIGGVHIGMNITLPDFFDQFFDFTRVITLVMFDIGLIYGLYRLLGGAS